MAGVEIGLALISKTKSVPKLAGREWVLALLPFPRYLLFGHPLGEADLGESPMQVLEAAQGHGEGHVEILGPLSKIL